MVGSVDRDDVTTEHPSDPEVAAAVAAQLEQLLDEGTLTVGTPTDVTALTTYPDARAIAMPFTIADTSDASDGSRRARAVRAADRSRGR